jgi:hypothetical protein
MIDEKIIKVKALIEERERIDRELAALFGLTDQPKRGRPRKDAREAIQGETTGWSITQGESHSETTTSSRSDGRGDVSASK